MTSYVEITCINNLLVCLLAYQCSSFFLLCKNRDLNLIIGILIEQILVVILFENEFYFYIYEYIFYFFFLYINLKKAIVYVCLKYIFMFTQFKFYGGSFYMLHYFVDINSNVLGLWILLLFILALLKCKWSYFIKISDLIFPITIYAERKINVYAFLDTGNSLMYKNTPVIFLDNAYNKSFNSMNKEEISSYSISGINYINAYLCKVKINHKVKTYYICCDKRIRLEFRCKALLNINM